MQSSAVIFVHVIVICLLMLRDIFTDAASYHHGEAVSTLLCICICSTAAAMPSTAVIFALHSVCSRRKAGVIMHKRKYGKEQLEALVSAMLVYKAGAPPYDLQYGGENFNVRAWWSAVRGNTSTELVNLALLLLDIVPHAAATERIFSMLGWFHSKLRTALGVELTDMLSTTRQHYMQQQPAVAERVVKRVRTESKAAGAAAATAATAAATAATAAATAAEATEPVQLALGLGGGLESVSDFDVNEEDIDDLIAALQDGEPEAASVSPETRRGILGTFVVGAAAADARLHAGAAVASAPPKYSLADLLSPWQKVGLDVTADALNPFATVALSAAPEELGGLGGSTDDVDVDALIDARLG